MASDDEAVDWRKLREFADVELTDSFVLSWHFEAATLIVDVDLLLLPDHPFYEKPRPAEKVCIRPALIEFPFCEAFELNGTPHGADFTAAVAELGHGAITGLQRLADGRYEIGGDFGVVRSEAERPLLRLRGP